MTRVKNWLKRHAGFYLVGLLVMIGLKYFYSRAGAGSLDWLLAPVARWAGFLSGIHFKKEPGVGYINHDYRFIIAPACSGMQFMIITFATLVFSFVHRMRNRRSGFGWMAASVGCSYLFTVFINGIRITLSLYLPARFHTHIGIAVYFTALLAAYAAADALSRKISGTLEKSTHISRYAHPLFWYFAVALIVPLLNRAYQNDGGMFLEYAALVIVVCIATICLCGVIRKLWLLIRNTQK